MSIDHPNPIEDDFDDELSQALTAVFGAEGLAMLHDELGCEDDHDPQGANLHNVPFQGMLEAEDKDSSLMKYVKEISSAIYAEKGGQKKSAVRAERFVLFFIGIDQFGISLADVKEIERCQKVTELPLTPNWLRGVMNLRGQVISVTDFRCLIENKSPRPLVGEKIIVVQCEQHQASTAIVVDHVIGIRSPEKDRSVIPATLANESTLDSIVYGSLDFDGVSTPIVDAKRLFGCPEMGTFF